MADNDPAVQIRLRRLEDVMAALDQLADDEMPPLPVLFRLSELGIKDPAGQPLPVLKRRIMAIHLMYQDRFPVERRRTIRRGQPDHPLAAETA
jgi:hypothetical protein